MSTANDCLHGLPLQGWCAGCNELWDLSFTLAEFIERTERALNAAKTRSGHV